MSICFMFMQFEFTKDHTSQHIFSATRRLPEILKQKEFVIDINHQKSEKTVALQLTRYNVMLLRIYEVVICTFI